MKKMVTLMLAIAMALTLLAGCSKQAVCKLTVNNDSHYSVAKYPEINNKVSFEWQSGIDGEKDHGTLKSKQDATYTFVLEDYDTGEQYTIVIECKGGKAEITDNGGLDIEMTK